MLSLARRRAPTRLLRRLCSDARAATPEETVNSLDEHIVGQQQAKKAVAIALRDRWRRQQLPEDLQQEIMPNNILMVGPTGVGKTEIARRLARLSEAPFVKVEATKYTEVGIYGTDTEDMIKDLVEVAIKQQIERARAREATGARARRAARRRAAAQGAGRAEGARHLTREACLDAVRAGTFDDEEVAVESRQSGPRNPLEALFGGGGGRGGGGGARHAARSRRGVWQSEIGRRPAGHDPRAIRRQYRVFFRRRRRASRASRWRCAMRCRA